MLNINNDVLFEVYKEQTCWLLSEKNLGIMQK